MESKTNKLLSILLIAALALSLTVTAIFAQPAQALTAEEEEQILAAAGAANLPDGVQKIIDDAAKVPSSDADIQKHIDAKTCPMCGATGVTWSELNSKTTNITSDKAVDTHYHYYCKTAYNRPGNVLGLYTNAKNSSICFAMMSGCNINNNKIRFVMLGGTNNTINIMGTGKVVTNVTTANSTTDPSLQNYGMFQLGGTNCHVNLYGGTYIFVDGQTDANRVDAGRYPIVRMAITGGTFNIFNNTVIGPEVAPKDSVAYNLAVNNGTVNMYGGTIRNGVTNDPNRSGNVTIAQNSTSNPAVFNMYGGTITGGTYKQGEGITSVNSRGGNVQVGGKYEGTTSTYKGTFNMYGGTITGGSAYYAGGNVASNDKVGSVIKICGGTIENGCNTVATSFGGNIYMGSGVTGTMTGGLITGGKVLGSKGYGGNVAVMTTTFNMTGGVIANGEAYYDVDGVTPSETSAGPNIYMNVGTVNMGGNARVVGGKSYSSTGAGSIYMTGSGDTEDTSKYAVLNLSGNAIVEGGDSQYTGGGNIYAVRGLITISENAIVRDGKAKSYGGNVGLTKYSVLTLKDNATISGGDAKKAGGNIQLGANATLNVQGGTISNGTASTEGGNIYITGANATMNISGGTITGGNAGTRGGNIYISASTVNLTGGTITKGVSAGAGGNIYVEKKSLTIGEGVTVSDGICNATDYLGGGNVCLYGGYTLTTAGNILNGKTTNAGGGGNICIAAGAKLVVNGGVITGGTTESATSGTAWGGNIRAYNNDITINGGLIYGGSCVKTPDSSNITCLTGESTAGADLIINGGVIIGRINTSGASTYEKDKVSYNCPATNIVLSGDAKIVKQWKLENGTTIIGERNGLKIANGNTADISGLQEGADICVYGTKAGQALTKACDNADDLKGYLWSLEKDYCITESEGQLFYTKHTKTTVSKQDATCEEVGYTNKYYYCAICDAYITTSYAEPVAKDVAEIAALGHDMVDQAAKAPTCTEIGWDAYKACSRCDESTKVEIKATGHAASAPVQEKVVDATLNAPGSYEEVVYCGTCGEELSRETKDIPQLTGAKASINGWFYATVEEAAANVKAGETIKLLDNATVSAPLAILTAKLDLNGFVLTGDVAGTVLLSGGGIVADGQPFIGNGAYAYMSSDAVLMILPEDITVVSGTVTVVATLPGLPSAKLTIAEAANLVIAQGVTLNVHGNLIANGNITNNGTIALIRTGATVQTAQSLEVIATVGDKVLYKDGVYAVHTHNVVIDKAIAPTCEATGLTEGKHCDLCEEVLVAQDPIDALGHKYTGVETTAPTCEGKGVMTYTCANDASHTYTEEIAATGHNYESVVTAPTCEADGYTTHTCKNDPTHTYVDSTVAALGHKYTEKVTVAPSCTEAGEKTFTCVNGCGDSYTEEIPATGHTIVLLTPAQAPANCVTPGKAAVYTCTACGCYFEDAEGEIEQDSETPSLVFPKGHALTFVDASAATCEADGIVAHYLCSVCGGTYAEENDYAIETIETVIPKLGHSYTNYIYNNDATYEADGTETAICDNGCGTTDTRIAEGTKIPGIAQIGETKYPTLQAAIEAAQAGDTIVLLDDVTIAAEIATIYSNGQAYTGIKVAEGITIDGAGHTLTVTGAAGNTWSSAIYMTGGTVKNLTIAGGAKRGILVNCPTGDVTVENVSVSDALYALNTNSAGVNGPVKLTVTNSTLNGWTSVSNASVAEATFENCKFGKSNRGEGLTDYAYFRPYCATTISGAETTFAEGFKMDANNANITIAAEVPAEQVAKLALEEDCKLVENADGSCIICVKVYVAQIGETKYETLQAAIEAAQAGDTIVLLDDVTIAAEIATIYSNGQAYTGIKVAEGITIDGAGHTLTVTGAAGNTWSSAIYMTGGAVKNLTIAGGAKRGILVNCPTGDVTVENVSVSDALYALNTNSAGVNGPVKLTVTNSTLNGWTSVSNVSVAEATFENCKFGKSNRGEGLTDYAYFRPYCATTISGAETTFAEGFKMDANNANITIAAEVPAEQVAKLALEEDCKLVENADGSRTICVKVYVVRIGEAKYESLQEACAAAQAGDTIVLLSDVEVSFVQIPAGVSLNLDGYTVSGTVLGKLILNGGNLITAEGYKMIGANADYYKTSNAVIDMTATEIEIVSGTVTLAQSWWTAAGQTLTIGEEATFVIPEGMNLNVNGSAVVVEGTAVVDGSVTLYSKNATIQAVEGLNVVTSAGDMVWYNEGVYKVHDHSYTNYIYNNDATYEADGTETATCDNGCSITDTRTAEGTKIPAIAQIGDTKYATLQAAIDAAQNGETIVLLEDITVESSLSNAAKGLYNIAAGQKITIDLNGKTINVTDNSAGNFIVFYSYGDLTIKNGTVNLTATKDREWNAQSTIILNRGGNLTIESGSYIHNGGTAMAITVDNSANSYGDAMLTVSGGEIKSTYTAIRNRMANPALNGNPGNGVADIVVTGGTITGGSRGIWGQITDASSEKMGSLAITGGTIEGGNQAINIGADGSANIDVTISGAATVKGALKGEGADFAISGGIFTAPVAEELCAEGYIPAENGDGTYGVAEEPNVAKIGDTKYETLQAALAAAKAGETVKLLKNVDASSEIILLMNGVDLDLNGKELKANYLIATTGGSEIIDSGNGRGILIVAKANLTIVDPSCLPVWVAADGGYRFSDVKAYIYEESKSAESLTLWYWFEECELDASLKPELANVAENELKIVLRIDYTYSDGSAATLDIVVPQDKVVEYAQNNNAPHFSTTIRGLNALGDATITVYAIYGDVEIPGYSYNYTAI